jgi:hypothetical protein
MPTSLVLVSAGFLMLPVASKLEHRRHATVQAQALGPLWAALLRRHPQVHLPLTSLTNPGPRFISQRRLIEISDALEEVLVDEPRDIDELAQAIVNPPTNTARTQAKEALIRIDPTPWPQPILGLSRAVARQTGTDEEDLRRLQQARPSSAARGIAAALTPANLVLALLAYASLRHAGAQSGLFWFALTAVFVVLVPYLILGWALRTGRVDDRQVVRRSQRPALLAAAATSVALAVALLVVLDAPAPLTALVVAMLAGLMVMATISLALKASMHLAVAAGAATILAVDGATPLAGLAFLTLPVLGWARWREGRHSVVQLAAGAALGSLVAGLLYSALR